MSWKAKEDVLWFKKGQIVDEIADNLKPHFEEVKSEKPKVEIKPSFKKKKTFNKK